MVLLLSAWLVSSVVLHDKSKLIDFQHRFCRCTTYILSFRYQAIHCSKENNVPFHERPPFCEEVLVLKMEALLELHSIRHSAKKCGCFFYAPAAAMPFALIE